MCTQNPNERNYHVFYELLAGADEELLARFDLQKEGKYKLLNAGRDGRATTPYVLLPVVFFLKMLDCVREFLSSAGFIPVLFFFLSIKWWVWMSWSYAERGEKMKMCPARATNVNVRTGNDVIFNVRAENDVINVRAGNDVINVRTGNGVNQNVNFSKQILLAQEAKSSVTTFELFRIARNTANPIATQLP